MAGRGVSLGARFVLLAVLALALMVVDQRQDHLERVRSVLNLAVYPIRLAVDMPFSAVKSLRASMADRGELLEEKERLEYELRVARIRLQDYDAIVRENERLRRIVDAQDPEDLDIRMAEILKVDLENQQRFIINRGANDGVWVGQALLDADGIVGQVRAVSEFSSEALLITDASHRVHVANVRTSQRMILQGTGDSRVLRALSVTNEDDVQVGDELETTGLGDVFPRGRPVARITEFKRGQTFATVWASPIADLDRDREVLLVMRGGPSSGAASAADAAASPEFSP
jgi:rod shape-determining protein MreC